MDIHRRRGRAWVRGVVVWEQRMHILGPTPTLFNFTSQDLWRERHGGVFGFYTHTPNKQQARKGTTRQVLKLYICFFWSCPCCCPSTQPLASPLRSLRSLPPSPPALKQVIIIVVLVFVQVPPPLNDDFGCLLLHLRRDLLEHLNELLFGHFPT